jgi:multicomponent K+:H+ antiporter subunit E/multicomponent Na+:H+ antiporter subunit E
VSKLLHALALTARFVVSVLRSGVHTAILILSFGQRPEPALVRMKLAPLTEVGAALLGSLVTLTPGTTAIDVDLERDELLLHLLDGSDPDATVREIREQFEVHVVALFGRPA